MPLSSSSIESIVKVIFPLGAYEFEGREDNELIKTQIEVILKRIKDPSKGGSSFII